jgi:hypothetical protein
MDLSYDDYSDSFTFTSTGSSLYFCGTSGTPTVTGYGSAFNNVYLGTDSEGGILYTSGDLDVNGTFEVQNGGATTLDISNDTIYLAGNVDLSNIDTLTVTSSTFC